MRLHKIFYALGIPHGFTVYFDNGDMFNVTEAASPESLSDECDLGDNQGCQTDVDGEDIILEKPSSMGGATYPAPTESELKQYAII